MGSFDRVTASTKRRCVAPEVEVTEEGVVEMLVTYNRKDFPVDTTPKTALYVYCRYRQH